MNDHDPLPEKARSPRGGTATWLRFAIPIAAGAILVALAPKFFPGRAPEKGKMPAGESEPAPPSPASPTQPSSPASVVVALFPFGTFAEPPPKFIWTRDPLATAYRLELLNQSENLFFSKETTDTTFVLPPDDPGWSQIGSWRVTPLLGGGVAGRPSDPMLVRIDPSLR